MKLFLQTIFAFILLIVSISCSKEKSQSTKNLLNGKWKLSSVEWLSGTTDQVPEKNTYFFILNSNSSGNTFSIDNNKGSWSFKDSIIFMEYIPSQIHSKVDSLIIINRTTRLVKRCLMKTAMTKYSDQFDNDGNFNTHGLISSMTGGL